MGNFLNIILVHENIGSVVVASFRFFVNFYQSLFTGLLFFIKYDKILVALYKRVAFSRINSHYFFNWLLGRAVFFIIYPFLLQTILR